MARPKGKTTIPSRAPVTTSLLKDAVVCEPRRVELEWHHSFPSGAPYVVWFTALETDAGGHVRLTMRRQYERDSSFGVDVTFSLEAVEVRQLAQALTVLSDRLGEKLPSDTYQEFHL